MISARVSVSNRALVTLNRITVLGGTRVRSESSPSDGGLAILDVLEYQQRNTNQVAVCIDGERDSN